MKFILTFTMKTNTEQRDEAIARFLNSGGKPPRGAKLLGRWTKLDFSGGFALLESDNPQALVEFSLAWSDLMDLCIVPVIEDRELGGVLQKLAGKRK